MLSLPLEMLPALSARKAGLGDPAFVPAAIIAEPEVAVVTQASAPCVSEGAACVGIMAVELVSGVVVLVPGDVAVERAAALVRALRGAL